MDDRDAVLDHATREIGALLAEAYLLLQLPPNNKLTLRRHRAFMTVLANTMRNERKFNETRIREEIEGLRHLTTKQLRDKYLEVFGEESRSKHKQFLFRRIAWRIQANAWGGISERARRYELEIADDADLRIKAPPNFLKEEVDESRTADDRVALTQGPRLPLLGKVTPGLSFAAPRIARQPLD